MTFSNFFCDAHSRSKKIDTPAPTFDMIFFLVTFFFDYSAMVRQPEGDTQEPTVHEHRWAQLIRPMAIAMAFLSLYWLSFFISFIRTPMSSFSSHQRPGYYILSSRYFQLQLLSSNGHICFHRCKWYNY